MTLWSDPLSPLTLFASLDWPWSLLWLATFRVHEISRSMWRLGTYFTTCRRRQEVLDLDPIDWLNLENVLNWFDLVTLLTLWPCLSHLWPYSQYTEILSLRFFESWIDFDTTWYWKAIVWTVYHWTHTKTDLVLIDSGL